MNKTTTYEGIFTALVTPFKQNGEIDWHSFDALLDRQLEAGIHGLVPVGTTGEAATLSENETMSIIHRTVKRASDHAYILAGTGSNSTLKTVATTQAAAAEGIDGALVVTPYYNKPSQQGLIKHFQAVAESVDIDIILYSVPGRSVISIEADTANTLKNSLNNIAGIKEAGGDPARVTELRSACGIDFNIHCGDDNLALPFYSLGASGLTSVLSNFDPEICISLYNAWKNGDIETALILHELIYPMASALFIDSSPSPVKAAMSRAGNISDTVRMPLASMSSDLCERLYKSMDSYHENRSDILDNYRKTA
ncbi:MAG: 4-hydroxy-tetrahydrodipicolinate synthase [Gammaproteobacteria bacterium]|jgi:4-hydroxy-tetrahydrodipicolinate synthase|nr:4-hydroxy-tetrahydrodipicolinate synthase [Gammaproteobacteria bacterium]MBT3724995.1 4-hydroxy-tetrahydrodipicolinate synthase [Gammaproteobacteria bacterium]MBT4075058.1 4-hydroxy-tetrahydrodipicolinate synthase [Gammaproteobacteria bacterium]MBT4193882.1 4-hydroxy-tetrahydrodipicolinate synthase [Gammaproteobacteria bacterium]MBT4449706.1 4-hydroxy-tetrahydrodipicolinate synthase [Gammaproteobacteria bacterium]